MDNGAWGYFGSSSSFLMLNDTYRTWGGDRILLGYKSGNVGR